VLGFAEPWTRRVLCKGSRGGWGRVVGPRRLNLCETGDANMLVLLCGQLVFVFSLIGSLNLLSNFITGQPIL